MFPIHAHTTVYTVNQLLIACEKFSRGSQEPHCRKYFLFRASICHIFVIKKKTGVDKAGRKNLSLQLSSSQVNPKIKSLRIIVCSQYLF